MRERLKNCFYGKKGTAIAADKMTFSALPESAKRQLDIFGITSTEAYENSKYKLAFVPHVNHILIYSIYLMLLLTVVSSIVSRVLQDAASIFDNKYQDMTVLFNGSAQIEFMFGFVAYVLFIYHLPFFVREFYDTYIKPYSLQLVNSLDEE